MVSRKTLTESCETHVSLYRDCTTKEDSDSDRVSELRKRPVRDRREPGKVADTEQRLI